MKTGNKSFIYRNKLDKACFKHDMAYGKSKDLVKRTKPDKVFKIASNRNYGGYQRELASMVYKCFDKKSKASSVVINEPNYQLANNFIKQLIENFKIEKFFHHLETIFGVLI